MVSDNLLTVIKCQAEDGEMVNILIIFINYLFFE